MLYPSIQELLTATAKNGEEKLNKYSITMATAKCARIITNDYIEQRHNFEKKNGSKDGEKDLSSGVKKEYRDEKAVKNALREMKEGKFEIYLPGEEGYEDSIVIVEDYVEPKEENKYVKPVTPAVTEQVDDEDEELDEEEEIDGEEEFDSEDLMGASTVFDNDTGYSIEEDQE